MKKLYIISATLFCNNVNAEWGQEWGSMVWGQSSANAPMMGITTKAGLDSEKTL